jgi:polar amino acid transport system substrate-binding protein
MLDVNTVLVHWVGMNKTKFSRTIIISIIFLVTSSHGIVGCYPTPEEARPFNANIPITANRNKAITQTTAPLPRQMIITYYSDYRPMSWMDQNGEMHGAFIDIFDEALNKRMGISIQHRGYPWVRAQEMVRRGEADAFCTTPTEERAEYTEISKEIILENKISLFTNKSSPHLEELKQIDSLQDLSSFAMSNYSGNGWAKQRLSGMDVTWVTTPEQALKMVASGRSDAYVDSSMVTNDLIRRMGLTNIVEIPVTFDAGNFYFFIGKKSPYVSILPKFDETIKEMKDSGDLQNILDKYLTPQ